MEPVYVFDQMVIPAGTAITGEISAIDALAKKRRILAAMNGEFSPLKQVHVIFTDLLLADGRHIPVKTDVSNGSGQILQLLVAAETKAGQTKKGEVKNFASREIGDAERAIKADWEVAKTMLTEPGRVQRAGRFAEAQLPYHSQYMDSGTSFNANLRSPIEFGSKPLTPTVLKGLGLPIPGGSVVHAILVTPIDSAHSKRGDAVEARITQPLISSGRLFLPEGSRLLGSVLQVRPAGMLHRNGQLRISFHQVVLPGGIQQAVDASLAAVAAQKGEHLMLDSEGGAQVSTPKTRYLTTAISIALASSSMADHDRGSGIHGADSGDLGQNAVNGASGFGFLGSIIGVCSHSRVVGSAFGFYGAGISVYSQFLARGRDVVYPRDMSMTIEVGTAARQKPSQGQPVMP